MKKILEWLAYEMDDSSLRNRMYNNVDYFLAFLYFVISVHNAIFFAYEIDFSQEGKMKESIATALVIVVNIVILLRTYVKLSIQFNDEERKAKSNLEKNVRYDRIVIEALEKRMSQVRSIWIIFIVVLGFVWFYGNVVVQSVGVLAVACAGLTFYNDIIDIAVNKFFAECKVGAMKYIERR